MPLKEWLAEEAKRTGLTPSKVHYRLQFSMTYAHIKRKRVGRYTHVVVS